MGGLLAERSCVLVWCEQTHVAGADKFIKALVKQVYKLPNVRKVVLLTDVSRVERGLVLIKVATPPGTRTEIMELVSIFRGSVVDVSDETLTIAVCDSQHSTLPSCCHPLPHPPPCLSKLTAAGSPAVGVDGCCRFSSVLAERRGPTLKRVDSRSIGFQMRPNRRHKQRQCGYITLIASARNHPSQL
jgi:hypothetical protein